MGRLRLIFRVDFGDVKWAPNGPAQRGVNIIPPELAAPPLRVYQGMQPLAPPCYLRCWNSTKRPCPVFGFVMTANKITAGRALPKWQTIKVGTVRINLAAVCQNGGDFGTASATIDAFRFGG